jgi:hypothetical protein
MGKISTKIGKSHILKTPYGLSVSSVLMVAMFCSLNPFLTDALFCTLFGALTNIPMKVATKTFHNKHKHYNHLIFAVVAHVVLVGWPTLLTNNCITAWTAYKMIIQIV